jgi:hypothetical protein
MKLFRSVVIPLLAICCLMTACKRTPAPPTEKDAIAVWSYISSHPPLPNTSALINLKQTNSQVAEVNGVKVYTLYFEATQRHLIKLGNHDPGWVETYNSSYLFEWTDAGWKGPDGQIYPAK